MVVILISQPSPQFFFFFKFKRKAFNSRDTTKRNDRVQKIHSVSRLKETGHITESSEAMLSGDVPSHEQQVTSQTIRHVQSVQQLSTRPQQSAFSSCQLDGSVDKATRLGTRLETD